MSRLLLATVCALALLGLPAAHAAAQDEGEREARLERWLEMSPDERQTLRERYDQF